MALRYTFNPITGQIDIIDEAGAFLRKASDEAERLSFVANNGDLVVQTDTNEVYEYNGASWDKVAAPGVLVQGDEIESNHTPTNYVASDTFISSNLEGIDTELGKLQELNSAENEPTGFPNRTDSEISFDSSTRTLTISPTGSSFSFFEEGTKFTKSTPQTVVIDDAEGMHYIYFDSSGTLVATQTLTDNIIVSFAYVCAIYWNAEQKEAVYVADERHGITMDGVTHIWAHRTFGTVFDSGLGPFNLSTDSSGSDDSSAQLAVDNGVIRDEDIKITIQDGSPQTLNPIAQLPVFYQQGTSANPLWKSTYTEKTWEASTSYNVGDTLEPTVDNGYTYYCTVAGTSDVTEPTWPTTLAGTVTDGGVTWQRFWAKNFPVLNALDGTNRPYTNILTGGNWTLTESGDLGGASMCMHIFATNDIRHPVVAIMGQEQYVGSGNARNGSQDELNNIIVSVLPFEEFKPIATILYQTSSGYTNDVKARTRDTDLSGNTFVDWRETELSPGNPGTAHGLLVGLANDDHLQYALLAGRSGGQTLVGGTDSGNDLSFQTTSDATKGDYIFSELAADRLIKTGASSELDEVAGTGFVKVTSGSPSVDATVDLTGEVENVLPVANGGTNSGTALNNNRVMLSDTGAIVEADALADGQILIGTTGGAPAPANISGTTDEIDVTNGNNSITLSLSIPPSSDDIAETSFSGAQNQAFPTNITGFLFNNAAVRSFSAHVSISIDATTDLFEQVHIQGIQKGSDWDISISSLGDDSLVDFGITSSGQMQYTSQGYSGFSSLTIKFRAITTSV